MKIKRNRDLESLALWIRLESLKKKYSMVNRALPMHQTKLVAIEIASLAVIKLDPIANLFKCKKEILLILER